MREWDAVLNVIHTLFFIPPLEQPAFVLYCQTKFDIWQSLKIGCMLFQTKHKQAHLCAYYWNTHLACLALPFHITFELLIHVMENWWPGFDHFLKPKKKQRTIFSRNRLLGDFIIEQNTHTIFLNSCISPFPRGSIMYFCKWTVNVCITVHASCYNSFTVWFIV